MSFLVTIVKICHIAPLSARTFVEKNIKVADNSLYFDGSILPLFISYATRMVLNN